jgi:hypothetical protein
MKMTLVVDTEDPHGIRDAYKIIGHFHKRVDTMGSTGREVRYSKIHFIKVLRTFAREGKAAVDRGEDPASLKFAKKFADEIFIDKFGL